MLDDRGLTLLRDAEHSDLSAIVEIYNDAVLTSTATFEENMQSVESRRDWFSSHGKEFPLVVAVANGEVIGFCSLSLFQKNSGYRNTAELTVYVEKENRRKGIATILMDEILERARKLGFHAIISSISSDNLPSVKLHEKFRFEKVAHLREVGFKFSKWQDTCYYELIL